MNESSYGPGVVTQYVIRIEKKTFECIVKDLIDYDNTNTSRANSSFLAADEKTVST